MSCVREASPSPPDTESENSRHEVKKKRFHPLRGLRRIFRRKGRPVIGANSDGNLDPKVIPTSDDELQFADGGEAIRSEGLRSGRNADEDEPVDNSSIVLEQSRSHSTSHLTENPDTQRRSFHSTLLSLSHDSVFTIEQRSPNSDSESSLYTPPHRLGFPHSSIRAELFEVVRRRRNNSDEDDDLGLPNSPVSSSPFTSEDVFSKANLVTKSSRSTCSDGSLLSMRSSEIDEELFGGRGSRNSSKLSLHDKRSCSEKEKLTECEKLTNVSVAGKSAVLTHNAAKHKLAVKPKRNHGAPQRKRQSVSRHVLPSTPEDNEDITKNTLPSDAKTEVVAETILSDTRFEQQILQLHGKCITEIHSRSLECSMVKSKMSSLPSDTFAANVDSNSTRDNPYDSDIEDTLDGDCHRKDENFFTRLLSKRGSKKKKDPETSPVHDASPIAARKNIIEQHRSDTSDFEYEHTMKHTYTIDIGGSEKSLNSNYPSENSSVKLISASDKSNSSSSQSDNNDFLCDDSPIKNSDALWDQSYENKRQPATIFHHFPFRQRVEPLNISEDASSEFAFNMFAPPKLVLNSETENRQRFPSAVLRKSFSFCEEDKVPTVSTDPVSLPVNIGLIEDETMLPKYKYTFVNSDDNIDNKEQTNFVNDISETNICNAEDIMFVNRINLTDHPKSFDSSRDFEQSDITVSDGKLMIDINNPISDVKLSNSPDTKVSTPIQLFTHSDTRNSSPTKSDIYDAKVLSSSKSTSPSDTLIPVEYSTETIFKFPKFNIPKLDHEKITPEITNSTEDVITNVRKNSFKSQTSIVNITNTTYSNPHISISNFDSKCTNGPSSMVPCNKIVKPISTPVTCSISIKPDTNEKANDKQDGKKSSDAASNNVIMRRKSKEVVIHSKDDEPELMKVFARRSLKFKEPDSEPVGNDESSVKSRDSDKENEGVDSPPEERKKKDEVSEIPSMTNKFVNNIAVNKYETSVNNCFKYQRSISTDSEPSINILVTNHSEKRQRSKTADHFEIKPCAKEDSNESKEKPETNSTAPFKRIQQRRDEWEKRVQLAKKIPYH